MAVILRQAEPFINAIARPTEVPSRHGAEASLATSAQRPRSPLLEQACEWLLTVLRERLTGA